MTTWCLTEVLVGTSMSKGLQVYQQDYHFQGLRICPFGRASISGFQWRQIPRFMRQTISRSVTFKILKKKRSNWSEIFHFKKWSFDYDKYNWVETYWPSFSFTPQRKVTSVYIKRYPTSSHESGQIFSDFEILKVLQKNLVTVSSIFCWIWFTYAERFVLYVLRYAQWNS